MLFRALGDRSRLLILRALACHDLRVNELVAILGLSQPTVSGHLAVLKYSGLVTVETQRNHRLYRLARPQLLQDLLIAAELLLRGTEYASPPPTDGCSAGGVSTSEPPQ